MKKETKKQRSERAGAEGKAVCRTISLPADLALAAQAKVDADPELDFSKYVRRLVRSDLSKAA